MINIPTLTDPFTLSIMDEVAHKCTDDSILVEVGVFLGGTLCYLGQRCKELGKRPQIIAIDSWLCDNISDTSLNACGITNGVDFYSLFLENLRKTDLLDIVSPKIGDSIQIAQEIQNCSIDFIFLDGNHNYPYVEEEIQTWIPKMKSDATIAGHDFCNIPQLPHVLAALLPNYRTTKGRESYIASIGKGFI